MSPTPANPEAIAAVLDAFKNEILDRFTGVENDVKALADQLRQIIAGFVPREVYQADERTRAAQREADQKQVEAIRDDVKALQEAPGEAITKRRANIGIWVAGVSMLATLIMLVVALKGR